MATDLYRTYEVLVEESVHPDSPKRAKDKTSKPSRFGDGEIDGALRDTHMIYQDAVCYNTLLFAGLAGDEKHGGEFLNPLSHHLTTKDSEGGILAETERVIRRLATHYKPLKDVRTPDDFLNCVYSEPLRIGDEMSVAEQKKRRELRARCYRILEQFGTSVKESGVRECADMAEFKNNWAGLISDPESDAEIPGNGTYDVVWRELKIGIQNLSASEKKQQLINKTLERFAIEAEVQNKSDAERDHQRECEKLRTDVKAIENLPDTDPKKSTALRKARAAVKKMEDGRAKHIEIFLGGRRKKLAEATIKALKKPIAAKPSELGLAADEMEKVATRAAAIAADSKTVTKPHIRLHYKGGATGNFEKAMLRYWVMKEDDDALVRRAAVADFLRFIQTGEPKPEPKLEEGELIKQMPFSEQGASLAFPYFGKKSLEITSAASSPDSELDKAAFATAAEDVFKYKIRTEARKARVSKVMNVVRAYEGNGGELTADQSPSGKAMKIHGMGGDPRWKGMAEEKKGIEALLKQLGEGKDITSYGLRENTIGGWAEVRKCFLKLKGAKPHDGPSLAKDLEEAVDEEMNANRQGFGSADFFHALCAPEYHHLWSRGADHDRNDVKDFIPHFVGYCEWREELVDLLMNRNGTPIDRATTMSFAELEALFKKPIRYTWPGLLNRHKKPSYRYYDFTANLGTSFQFKSLYRRVRAKDTAGQETLVERYEKLTGDKARVTLAARRLKRDKIVNKDTGSSVDALWCPPLILAGEENSAATKPKAGKKKKSADDPAEVSFSLIAAPLPGDYWNSVATVPTSKIAEPVHLTVSFKVEGAELAKLQKEGVYFAGGSTKGVDENDDNRRFFRWPIDIETDRKSASEATHLPKKKSEVSPGKLWCAFNEGFLVKESRYAKDGETKRVPDFQILSIDLGNRFAAAFTRLRIHAEADGPGRVISADDGAATAIKADVTREGTLRLQGEDAEVWQLVTERNRRHLARKLKARKIDREPVVGSYELVGESYGNGGRGRFPTASEYDIFKNLATLLVPVEALSLSGSERLTYPELGDHLVFRLKRRLGRLRTLFNLVWRLCAEHEREQQTGKRGKARTNVELWFHRRLVVESLARSKFPKRQRQSGEVEEASEASLRIELCADEQWQKLQTDGLLANEKGAAEKKHCADLEARLKDAATWNWNALAVAVKKQIGEYFEGEPTEKTPALHNILVSVIEFCLPLKGRHWDWDRSRIERLHWDRKDEAHNPNVIGMRGLSMRRLQQLLDLRQRCQSYAKLEDRYHGPYKLSDFNPPDSSRDERPDVCSLLLERSNRIREQRVDQTAHLILAEALGMELKNPAEVLEKKTRKNEVDLHGEYQRRTDRSGNSYPRCSIIVMENLERYKMSLGRTRAENSRLMQWAHRAIIEKLEDMCRPFGITLMLVDPAFSSHFDSRNGLPGVRVNLVSGHFAQEHPYKKWVDGKTKSGDDTQLAKDIKALAKMFADNPAYTGELVLAVEGGKEFLPVFTSDGGEGLINADICAAGNIGLRGVTDPQRWDVFPRLRTKRVSDSHFHATNWRGWFGRFAKDDTEKRMLRAAGALHAVQLSVKPKINAEADIAEDGETQTSQSSEHPPFFVEHPNFGWPPEGDWLAHKAYEFQQGGKTLRAFQQGAYLRRVETMCGERIREINRGRVRNRSFADDKIPM